VADIMAEVLDAEASPEVIERVRPRVVELCQRFPVYGP
jgi:glycine/serine hydroxymethyltransferase